jgi:hypothetical protein
MGVFPRTHAATKKALLTAALLKALVEKEA